MNNLAENIGFTYSDYITWNDKIRWEIIDGEAYAMAAPSPRHQRISGEIFRQLANYLRGKPCEVFAAPLDVRLAADWFDNTVVQPDIIVICDNSVIDDKSIKGVPDFVIEILSPYNPKRDTVAKRRRYEQAGVKEYWIVDPYNQTVRVYILKGGVYGKEKIYGNGDIIQVHTLPGCSINMAEVFDSAYTETNPETEEPDPETEIKYNLISALKNKYVTKEQILKIMDETDSEGQ